MEKVFLTGVGRQVLTVTLAAVLSVLLVAMIAQAATTISDNISTGGTLSVTGASTLTGAVTTAGAVTLGDDVSDAITANGYFTQLRIGTGSTFDDIAAVGADELGVEGAMEVDGAAYFDGAVDMDSTLNVAGAATFQGLASTSSLTVGDEPSPTTINGLVFGYCTIPATTVAASSTAFAICTGATGVISGDRVFLQATSSLPANFMIQAASSTATAGSISVQLFNSGIIAGTAAGINSFNFWAAR